VAQVTVCFDLDGVLCSQTAGDYENAVPNREAIAVVQELHRRGVRIIVHTSRFMGRAGNDPVEAHRQGYELTAQQLTGWEIPFDELILGKPRYDVVVDDRSIFFEPDWTRIRGVLVERLGSSAT